MAAPTLRRGVQRPVLQDVSGGLDYWLTVMCGMQERMVILDGDRVKLEIAVEG